MSGRFPWESLEKALFSYQSLLSSPLKKRPKQSNSSSAPSLSFFYRFTFYLSSHLSPHSPHSFPTSTSTTPTFSPPLPAKQPARLMKILLSRRWIPAERSAGFVNLRRRGAVATIPEIKGSADPRNSRRFLLRHRPPPRFIIFFDYFSVFSRLCLFSTNFVSFFFFSLLSPILFSLLLRCKRR